MIFRITQIWYGYGAIVPDYGHGGGWMDLKYLRYITEIADERNISKAARKLGISQPSLSIHLAKLEEELGGPLFLRNRNELVPTGTGALYVRTAREMLRMKEDLYRRISDLTLGDSGYIPVGIFQNIGGRMVASVYPKFAALYPKVRVDITDARFQTLYEGLMRDIIRFAFVALFKLEAPDLQFEIIKDEEFVLALPADHPSAAAASASTKIDLAGMMSERFLLAPPGTVRRQVEDDLFARSGFEPRVNGEVHNLRTMTEMIAAGSGIGLVPRGYIDPSRKIAYFSLIQHPRWQLVAAWKDNATLSLAERDFIELAREYYDAHHSYL
ncbi:MAG TPA: hypothetical protein DIC34_18130 [Treponema sp.]|nr:hypothetical protein [Treponema sp.]